MKISVIIVTLNRYNDLKNTLESIKNQSIIPFEVLIIDQSDDYLDIGKNFEILNIKQFKQEIKSITLARNNGIKKIDKNSEIVVFLDDDIILEKDFFKEIEIFFNKNKNAKGGVANIKTPSRKINLIKKIGFILLTGSFKFYDNFVTRGGFNSMSLYENKKLKNVEWTSGCGMFFKKSIFDEGFKFDEKLLKYGMMEDVFFSYGIEKKYKKSLFLIPNAKMIHLESPSSRIENKSKIYQNIIHRYYFIKKYNLNILAYLWTIFILMIFDIINYKKISIFKYYYNGLKYIFKNNKNIIKNDFDFNKFIFND